MENKKEYFRVTWRTKSDNLNSPFMHQCWNKKELDVFIEYKASDRDVYDIKVYKTIEQSSLVKEIN